MVDNTHAGLDRFDQHSSIVRYLQEDGYRTGFAGKLFNFWHVEDDPLYFDRWSVYHPTNVRNGYFDMTWNLNGRLKQVHTYSTDFIAEQGVKFIRSSEANDDKPWFLELSTYAPHLGPGPGPAYANAPVGSFRKTPAMTERDRSDKPPFVQAQHATLEDGRKAREGQLRMLMSVDDLVAKVAATLRQTGEARDTLAIFVSDNGYLWGEHGVTAKGTPYSAGVHVPLLARWPGHIEEGTVDGRITAIIDIAPTILDAAGSSRTPTSRWTGVRSWTARGRGLVSCSSTGGGAGRPLRRGPRSGRSTTSTPSTTREARHVPRVLRPRRRPVAARQPAPRRAPRERPGRRSSPRPAHDRPELRRHGLP